MSTKEPVTAQMLATVGTLSYLPGDRCELAGTFSIVHARLALNIHPGSPPPVIRVLCHSLPEGGQAPLTPPHQLLLLTHVSRVRLYATP